MSKVPNTLRWIQRWTRRLFRAPFEELPPAFGDTVPPELRVFEAEADEFEHHPVGEVSPSKSHGHRRSKATQHKRW